LFLNGSIPFARSAASFALRCSINEFVSSIAIGAENEPRKGIGGNLELNPGQRRLVTGRSCKAAGAAGYGRRGNEQSPSVGRTAAERPGKIIGAGTFFPTCSAPLLFARQLCRVRLLSRTGTVDKMLQVTESISGSSCRHSRGLLDAAINLCVAINYSYSRCSLLRLLHVLQTPIAHTCESGCRATTSGRISVSLCGSSVSPPVGKIGITPSSHGAVPRSTQPLRATRSTRP
jgi:hypothetical protein